MDNSLKITVVGCGNLGVSIVNGLIAAGFNPKNITATRRNTKQLNFLAEKGVVIESDNLKAVKNADIVILALKPYNIEQTLKSLLMALNPTKHTLISVATGISIGQMEAIVGNQFYIYRAMPNTATAVNESITCIAYNKQNAEKTEAVQQIFSAIGTTLIIDENLMEAATILGACGIAYVLRFMRAMVQGGIQIGFNAQTATQIVNQTVLGASKLLIENGLHPEQEIDKVTTPKGCTIEGLNEMEHNGFSSSLIKGVLASYKKIEN
jgi:pyrroline-5-carboxylate reductase